MGFDAIVVGAGSVGSTVAEAIARDGYKVLVLEEHPQIGIPQHCAGKISVNAWKELNLPATGILQEIRGATFFSPDMNSLSVERKDAQAYIFDREVLDKWLSKKALDDGAELITDARVTNISINSQGVNVIFEQNGEYRDVTSRVVIGADGANSLIAKRLGLYSGKRSAVKVAIQREMTGLRRLKLNFVEVYLGKKYAPGFFAWIIPTGEGSARVGLCVSISQSKHLINCLENFITSHPVASRKLEGGRCTSQLAHVIPTGGALRQVVADGALVVGDAAGQVKSTTGGGLYYGMVCAKIAGQVVSKALSSGDGVLRRDVLMEYQDLWQKRLGREVELSAKLRILLDSLADEELNYLFKLIRENRTLLEIIEIEGDIDWQSKMSASTFKHMTRFMLRYPRHLPALIRYYLEYALQI